MPITYHIDPSSQLVRATFTDDVTHEEMVAYFRAVAAEPSYNRGFDRLIDWRAVRDIACKDVHMLAHLILESTGDIIRPSGDRRALVVRRGAQFGLARMLQIILDVAECRAELCLFHDIEHAEAWLAGRPEAAPASQGSPAS